MYIVNSQGKNSKDKFNSLIRTNISVSGVTLYITLHILVITYIIYLLSLLKTSRNYYSNQFHFILYSINYIINL